MTPLADAGDADASGYEPIWQDGKLVGFVTSGGYGHTTGKSLAMAMIDAEAAKLMAEKGAILCPTLVTYSAMAEMGERLGLPKINLEKNKTVLAAGLESIEIAKAAGVEMAFGTDLIGETQTWQNREFAIRAEVLSAQEILHSMYVVGPRLLKREGEVGVLSPGAMGDVVITNVNPLDDIAALANPERTLTHVIKGGEIIHEAEA